MWQWKLDDIGLKILDKSIVNGAVVVSTKDYRIFGNTNNVKYSHDTSTTYLKEQNVHENTTVLDEIKKHNYLYSEVWFDNEPLYIVYAMTKEHNRVDCSELEDFARHMCMQFKQKSFSIQRPGENLIHMNANDLKHNYDDVLSNVKVEDFCAESASVNEMRRRSSCGEVFLMPHIGKIQQKSTK